MEEAKLKLEELYDIHDHYFTADQPEKQRRLQGIVDAILELVRNSTPNTNIEIACLKYIKGKAFDVFSKYNEKSEILLTSSVKLDPLNLDAWASLGNCFWKKGDLCAAKYAFLNCIEYGQSNKALRHLSMLLRQMGQSPEEKSINIQASVNYAKMALKIDVTDGESWYVLGNAFLALFFCNTHSPSDLDRAFTAYKKAENMGAKNNPDLHYNRANVCRYKEDYAEAIQSYEKAHALDPSLPAEDAIESIVRWVIRVSDLIRRKGQIKAKKLDSLLESLSKERDTQDLQGRKKVCTSALSVGPNEGRVVALKLLMDVVRRNEPPGCFVMIDKEGTCVAVSIYHLDHEVYSKMTEKDVIYILDPFLKIIDVSSFETPRHLSYSCLQVAEPHLFLINGTAMADSYAHAQLTLDNFDL